MTRVALISGLGETATSERSVAGRGMADLLRRLMEIPGVMAKRYAWDGFRYDESWDLIVGHSFGGWSALLAAQRLRDRPVRLVLLDPVPHSWKRRWFGGDLELPTNVTVCYCFRAGDGNKPNLYPLAKWARGAINRVLPASHDSIIRVATPQIIGAVERLAL